MTQETHMASTRQKLTAILISAGSIALATETAHAWGGYYGGRPYAYRPYAANFAFRPPFYAYRPYVRAAYAFAPLYGAGYRAYAYYPYGASTGYYGSGTFSDGRRVPGTNYNPNQ